MIESRNLFKLESKLGGIPVKAIEKDYVLSWILIGIAKSKMFDIICLKGGTALKKFYFSDYRFSEDLDFTLLKNISTENLEKMLEEVYEHILELVNIRLALKSKETHINSYTFYINFSGPLGADLARGEIKIDFTIKEKLINQPIIKTLLREYDEYHDIPEDIELRLYSLEEIFMEKILSILDPNRKEPRDIYDLWYLISNECLEFQDLCGQIKEKGIYKGLTSFEIHDTLLSKEASYNRLWTERLAIHMMELPPFERVYRELKRYLKPLNQKLV